MNTDQIQENKIIERLTTIFRDVMDDNNIVITNETTANDIENWDSLSHINLLLTVEKEFGFKLVIQESRSLKNVGDMIALIREKLQ